MRLPSLPQKGNSVEQTVREIIAYLRASTLTSVVGGRLRESPNGKTLTIDQRAGGGRSASGAFFEKRTVSDSAEPAEDGDIYLQGGMVSGGTGNVVIPEIKLYDASSAVWAGTAGQTLIITVTGNGQETSGILDPIYNITAAVASIGAVGSNTLPESGSVSGKICYVLLGSYHEGGFSPSTPGNIRIGFCWGNYSVARS